MGKKYMVSTYQNDQNAAFIIYRIEQQKDDKTIRKLHKEMNGNQICLSRKLILIVFLQREQNATAHTQKRFEFLASLMLT